MEETATQAATEFTLFDPLLLIIVGMFVLMYFFTIRPQQKRAREHRELIAAIKVGDEIVTSGGIVGKITVLEDTVITLNSGESVLKVQRSSVVSALPRGTIT